MNSISGAFKVYVFKRCLSYEHFASPLWGICKCICFLIEEALRIFLNIKKFSNIINVRNFLTFPYTKEGDFLGRDSLGEISMLVSASRKIVSAASAALCGFLFTLRTYLCERPSSSYPPTMVESWRGDPTQGRFERFLLCKTWELRGEDSFRENKVLFQWFKVDLD